MIGTLLLKSEVIELIGSLGLRGLFAGDSPKGNLRGLNVFIRSSQICGVSSLGRFDVFLGRNPLIHCSLVEI